VVRGLGVTVEEWLQRRTQCGRARLQAFCKCLGEEEIDVAIVTKPQSVYYLSGFNPIIQSQPSAVVLMREHEPVLVVHSLRAEHAELDGWVDKVEYFGRWGSRGVVSPSSLLSAVGGVLGSYGRGMGRRIGLELSYLPAACFNELNELLPRGHVIDISRTMMALRRRKDEHEIACIRAAAGIADAGMAVAVKAVGEGLTEREISVKAMMRMQQEWLERYPYLEASDFGCSEGGVLNSLWAYCLSGPRMNLMCDSPGTRVTKPGEFALIVIWTALDGYHAENERTVAMTPISPEQEELNDAVSTAWEEGKAKLLAGRRISDVYLAAVEVMKRKGYGDIAPGRVGHGIGLGAHEEPALASETEGEFETGMVVSFEPSLRLGHMGGVQNSDTILIRSNGPEFLTHTQHGLIRV